MFTLKSTAGCCAAECGLCATLGQQMPPILSPETVFLRIYAKGQKNPLKFAAVFPIILFISLVESIEKW